MADLWSSARLIYRGVDDEDEDGILALLNTDPVAFLNAAPILPSPRSKKTSKEFKEYLNDPAFLVSAIICLPPAGEEPSKSNDPKEIQKEKEKEKPKPTPIGMLTLRGADAKNIHHRRCDIGINIFRDYQGQGYGTEAIKWSLRWGFKRANLHRMGIGCFAWNTGSLKLYERLGFVKEAVRRDFFWHDGKYGDCVELAMLENEWRELYDSEGKGE